MAARGASTRRVYIARDFAVLRIVQLNASKVGTVYGSVRGNDADPLEMKTENINGRQGRHNGREATQRREGKNRARYDILPDDATSYRASKAIELKVASRAQIPGLNSAGSNSGGMEHSL